MTSYSDFAPESSETLKLELQKQAVCEFLNDIENHFKFKKLLHSLQQVIRQNLYIPIQVTLERKYQHEVETFWGYGESEADIKHAWMLKRQYGIKGTELELQRPQVPWETEKKHHQRIMVLADPGMGKSALLRMEALSTARAERQKLLADEKSVDDVVFPAVECVRRSSEKAAQSFIRENQPICPNLSLSHYLYESHRRLWWRFFEGSQRSRTRAV
jgi:hypothetical protein